MWKTMKTIFASITFKKILKELTEIQLWGPIVFKKNTQMF